MYIKIFVNTDVRSLFSLMKRGVVLLSCSPLTLHHVGCSPLTLHRVGCSPLTLHHVGVSDVKIEFPPSFMLSFSSYYFSLLLKSTCFCFRKFSSATTFEKKKKNGKSEIMESSFELKFGPHET